MHWWNNRWNYCQPNSGGIYLNLVGSSNILCVISCVYDWNNLKKKEILIHCTNVLIRLSAWHLIGFDKHWYIFVTNSTNNANNSEVSTKNILYQKLLKCLKIEMGMVDFLSMVEFLYDSYHSGLSDFISYISYSRNVVVIVVVLYI